MNAEVFEAIKDYVGFDSADSAELNRLRVKLEPRLEELADVFYSSLSKHPEAKRIFKDQQQVDRLRQTLKQWAVKLCTGPFDATYATLRSRIGRIHVQVGLPQRYMITAMSVIRQFLSRLAQTGGGSFDETLAMRLALDKILDCELAIMLESYSEDLLGKLRRHERLAALGTVAVAVNHELKNPIGVLRTSVDALRRQWEHTPPEDLAVGARVKRHIEKLDRNIDKMFRDISSLLEFARYSDLNLEECDLHKVIDDALEESAVAERVQVSRKYDPSIGRIHVDPIQMARVFVNLARNASEVMAHGGTLTIETRALPGGTRIIFGDTGPGIPAEIREQIFQPLWTTKQGGTGMGLAICRNLIEAHRGKIWVESADQGASFHIDLPLGGERV